MKQRIKRFDVFQTGKVIAALYSFFGVLMVPFMLFGLSESPGGFWTLLTLFLYPILGFIGGIVLAAFYNWSANWVGGLVVTIETEEDPFVCPYQWRAERKITEYLI